MATFEEDRAHFGAWCVVSSPLVLGYDVTDSSVTEKVWPILSNRQAVQVNQQYAGHPGRLVKAWDVVPPAPAPPGCGYLVAGSCSNPTAAAKGWAYDSASGHLTHDGKCVTSTADPSELQVSTCDATSPNRELHQPRCQYLDLQYVCGLTPGAPDGMVQKILQLVRVARSSRRGTRRTRAAASTSTVHPPPADPTFR